MNKYVVAYLSLYDGEIKQEIVQAHTKFDAMASYLGWGEYELYDCNGSLDRLYEIVSDQDAYITVLELKHARAGRPGGELQPHLTQLDSESRVQ